MKTLKKLFLAAALVPLFSNMTVAAEPPETLFYDFQVSIMKADKPIYAGEVWIRRNGEAVLNTVKSVPFKTNCSPGSSVNNVPAHKDGVFIALATGIEDNKMVHVDGVFEVHESQPGNWVDSIPCKIEQRSSEVYRQKFVHILREQELAEAEAEPYKLAIKFVGSSPTLPQDKTVGTYYGR